VNVQAVVFDFDGTIFDTETVSYDAVADVYAAHNRSLDPAWWSTMIGTTVDATDTALERLAVDVGLDIEFVQVEIRARVRELLLAARPRPGVEAADIPLAIATSAPRTWVERHLANLGLLHDFPVVVPVDEVTYAKPHPEPYTTACRLLNADPRWSVAIEDSAPGVQSAVAAGLFTLGVASNLTRHNGLPLAHQQHDTLEHVRLADLHQAIQTRNF
jgi:HAD superfamily hydrolase (TIGR01509 family)